MWNSGLYVPPKRHLIKVFGASADIGSGETVAAQHLFGAGSWPLNWMLELEKIALTKSGTTDTCTMKVRVGALGTTGDTQIASASIMSAANQQWRGEFAMRLDGASSVQGMGGNSSGFTSGAANSANAAISLGAHSALATATYVSITLQSSGASNTSKLLGAQLWLVMPVP